jgi:hypothetical protein
VENQHGLTRKQRREGEKVVLSVVPRVGLEASNASFHQNSTLQQSTSADAAKSGAVDADLARIIEAWPSLSEAIRRAIVALVES